MLSHSFYSNPIYRKKQSEITKKNWQLGTFNFKVKSTILKICLNPKCGKRFYIKPYHVLRRKYCSKTCAAQVNNVGRKPSEITKSRISTALKGTHPRVPLTRFAPRTEVVCQNHSCQRVMLLPPWLVKRRKYCSTLCAITIIGRQTTSPKASKGKSGIRADIDPNIYFYSTWEANVARVFNLVGLKWQYAPKIFNLGKHTYRPDFYLTKFDTYVEVKNFMGDYSLKRDSLFRAKFPDIKLELILKDRYLEIKSCYKNLVDNWEY